MSNKLSLSLLLIVSLSISGSVAFAQHNTAAIPHLQFAETREMLINGGFEQGHSPWTTLPGEQLTFVSENPHSGEKCFRGEVENPREARRLIQHIDVEKGNIYTFSCWVRSSNRNKLVLFGTFPGEEQRRMISVWQSTPKSWKRVHSTIGVKQSGSLKLEIIAPSSYAAPVGKMWIDDVSLIETEMPEIQNLSSHQGYCDQPTGVQTDDGRLFFAWISYRTDDPPLEFHPRTESKGKRGSAGRAVFHEEKKGGDTLQLARLDSANDSKNPTTWTVADKEFTGILDPVLVDSGHGSATLIFAAEMNDQWDLFLVRAGREPPSAPIRLTQTPEVDVKPRAVFAGDRLWVTWESNPDSHRRILAMSMMLLEQEVKTSEALAISEAPYHSYDPTIALQKSGDLLIAYHSFRENNYDIYCRPVPPDSAIPGAERRLTRAPTIDRHPLLVSGGEDLWLIYENANTPDYHIGATRHRGLMVAKLEKEELLEPIRFHWNKRAEKDALVRMNDPTSSLFYRDCEAPSAMFDESGRLWIAFRKPRGRHLAWGTYLACLEKDRLTQFQPMSWTKGMDRRPALVLTDAIAHVAYQGDDAANRFWNEEESLEAKSDIFLASFPISKKDSNRERPVEFAALQEPKTEFLPAAVRQDRGEEAPKPAITYRGRKLRLFCGDLHEHSNISICNREGDQTLRESYQDMRDIARYDFACVTDHGYNMNPYLWHWSSKLARTNDDPGRFVTFLGMEWTSTFEEYSDRYPQGFYGHRNLVLADLHFPRWWNAGNYETPRQVWQTLRERNADFVHIPHQLADTGNVPTDWSFFNPVAQPVAEIFQTRGSYEYFEAPRMAPRTTGEPGNFLQDFWATGHIIGVIAAPDHGGGRGKAFVYAPALKRADILQALRQRYCYGTTGANIFLEFRANDLLMGEAIDAPPGKKVVIDISVTCPQEIEEIGICRNNDFIHTTNPEGARAKIQFVDSAPPEGFCYYYVRVRQASGPNENEEHIAWSSPVWFGVAEK